MGILEGKSVILGVTGGIAGYKAVEVLRGFKKAGADVRVLMTANACRFVGPLTFEALSGHAVCASLFDAGQNASIGHIEWAASADIVVVAPATANFIGKAANGIADDALSTFITAVTAPIVACPAMNADMYRNAAVERNMARLQADGWTLLTPAAGELACGATGPGRLPEPDHIIDRVVKVLYQADLAGRRILVTAGPTKEHLDPVRFISNPSSGKMGFALARAAEYRGARVVLVSGETRLENPLNVEVVRVSTARQMAEAVLSRANSVDIVIKAAAVSDYRPEHTAPQKIKKSFTEQTLTLIKNKDILLSLSQLPSPPMLVGFAAETHALETYAREKVKRKNLDMIVANRVDLAHSGFNADTNQVMLFYRNGEQERLPLMPKTELAHTILDRIRERLEKAR